MTIRAAKIVQQACPGQFVHILCGNSFNPLLRRPFSFHRLNGNSFEILYKVKGLGTKLLSKKRKGDKIDMLGPLGHGFDFRLSTKDYRLRTILVAGGMGVAPLLALAQSLADRKRITVLLGAKTKNEILCEREFKKLGCKVIIATDDGSLGHKGLVTGLLRNILWYGISKSGTTENCTPKLLPKAIFLRTTNNAPRPRPWRRRTQQTTLYSCGPRPMLKEVARISRHYRINAFGSLEENMACGVGACLGCAVETKAGFKQVCSDGPVFNLQEIKWERGG